MTSEGKFWLLFVVSAALFWAGGYALVFTDAAAPLFAVAAGVFLLGYAWGDCIRQIRDEIRMQNLHTRIYREIEETKRVLSGAEDKAKAVRDAGI